MHNFIKSHLKLITGYGIIQYFGQAWIVNTYTVLLIVFNAIVSYDRSALFGDVDAAFDVVRDEVLDYLSVALYQDETLVVTQDLVVFNFKVFTSFDNENTFLFALFNQIVHNFRMITIQTTQCNICLTVLINMISNNFRTRSFLYQNTLTVIKKDAISVSNRLLALCF